MAIFVVTTEEHYGGGDKLCVFRNERDGLNYYVNISIYSDIEKFEGDFPQEKVFVVVSEEPYGGCFVKVFTKQEEAEKYRDSPKFGSLDMMILEKDIL